MKQINLISQKTTYKLTGPGIDPNQNGTPVATFEKLISNFIGILTLVAVIWFTYQIIFAGLGMIGAQGDEKKLKESSSKLTNGVLGLFIVVIAMGLTALLSKILGLSNPFDLEPIFKGMGL